MRPPAACSGSRSPTKGHTKVRRLELSARLGFGTERYDSTHARRPGNPLRDSRLGNPKGLGGLHLITKVVDQLLDTVGHVRHH